MASNSFGSFFRLTTWGESHGPGIGVVCDGCPARMPLTEADIQPYLDKRRGGQSIYTTQRQEADQVRILSGTFDGQTTGTPISLVIDNTDQRSKDYDAIKDIYRPGHADYTYDAKYGIRDYRGGGRASARETACRVAAGAVARRVLEHFLGPQIAIRGAVIQIGRRSVDRSRWDWAEVDRNPFFTPDAVAAESFAKDLDVIRKNGLSTGAVIEIVASGFPVGLGDPVYEKLDSAIAAGLMSINAVKGVEIGEGFAAASLTGPENSDAIRPGTDGAPVFLSNHAGGILGGISTGQDIVARFAVKPTPSFLHPMPSINRMGEAIDVSTKGRHDPCVGIRAVPVGEAMMAIVLADALLRARAIAART